MTVDLDHVAEIEKLKKELAKQFRCQEALRDQMQVLRMQLAMLEREVAMLKEQR